MPTAEANDPRSHVWGVKISGCHSHWYFAGSRYDCTTNEADPQGSCRKLPEGNTGAVTSEKITVVSPELYSCHCLVLWVGISTTSLSYGADIQSKLLIKAILKMKSVITILHLLPLFSGHIWMDIFPWSRGTHPGLSRVRFLIGFLRAAAFAGHSEVPCHQLSLTLTLSHWESPPLLLLCVYFSSKTVPRPPTQCKRRAQRRLWPPLLRSGRYSEGGLWGRVNRE